MEYPGHRNSDGYGVIKIGGREGKYYRVHRLIYAAVIGPIPRGLQVLHTCDNPGCYLPKHLFLGTHKDNMADMVHKGRQYITWGTRNGNSKLTSNDVQNIRADGATNKILTQKYGVSKSTISEIKNRKSRAYE
jgi:hypothetical protein